MAIYVNTNVSSLTGRNSLNTLEITVILFKECASWLST